MSGKDYADLVFLRDLLGASFDERFGSEWLPEEDTKELFRSAMREALADNGYHVGHALDDLAEANLSWLLEKGGVFREGDSYTGTYYRLNRGVKNDTINSFLSTNEAAKRVKALGDAALRRALRALANELGWESTSSNDDVIRLVESGLAHAPASDRVVKFSDNQTLELETATTAVIDALARENSINGDADLKDIYLGQLKASRELILAQSVRAYLLYEAAVRALVALVGRYQGHVIGEASKYLLKLLFDQVFKP